MSYFMGHTLKRTLKRSLNQGLVMAKDTCKVIITKRLAWLVEPLVVSSHEFSFLFTLF